MSQTDCVCLCRQLERVLSGNAGPFPDMQVNQMRAWACRDTHDQEWQRRQAAGAAGVHADAPAHAAATAAEVPTR